MDEQTIFPTINRDYLIEVTCLYCGYVEYFEYDELPGGNEHCGYCSDCGELIVYA